MPRRPWFLLAALTAACGSAGAASETASTPLPTPLPTVPGVGVLPHSVPSIERSRAAEPFVVITRPVTEDGVLLELVGETVSGNRVLFIGDSIFAGTDVRYGGEMCAGLEPLGWAVDVEAEASRFIEFGVKVVKRLVPEQPVEDGEPDWDAAAVHLGSNYNGNQLNYEAKLREILDRLAPRPTLLYTVTEYRSNYSQVNDTVRKLGAEYNNVTVIDWGQAAKTPGVLSADGLHPGNKGEQVLVDLTAAALGRAPAGEADCIRSVFHDDSAIRTGNGTPNTGGSSSGGSSSSGGGGSSSSSSGGTPTTTVKPRPTTTTPGGGTSGGTPTTTSPGGTTTGGTTTGGTTTGGTTTGGTTAGGTTSLPPASTSPPPVVTSSPPASTSPPTVVTNPPPVVTNPPPVVTNPPPPPSQTAVPPGG